MRLKALGQMQSKSEVSGRAQIEPIAFRASAGAALQLHTDAVTAKFGRIPLRMAIPFLPRRVLPEVAAIGGFAIKLNPLYISVDAATVGLDGVLGTEGLRAEVAGGLSCETRMEVDGRLAATLGTLSIKLGDDELEFG